MVKARGVPPMAPLLRCPPRTVRPLLRRAQRRLDLGRLGAEFGPGPAAAAVAGEGGRAGAWDAGDLVGDEWIYIYRIICILCIYIFSTLYYMYTYICICIWRFPKLGCPKLAGWLFHGKMSI